MPRFASILPSHRYGIEYVEHCSVRAADDRLSYVRRAKAHSMHFSIPVENTAVLLLGPGTSLTQPAAFLCSQAQVLVGFCAGGATPVYLGALNEYREPRFARAWQRMWEDEVARLAVGKRFQLVRIQQVKKLWRGFDSLEGVDASVVLAAYEKAVLAAPDVQTLLSAEAHSTKALYALLARHFAVSFTRVPQGAGAVNGNLDNGNYLAYGLAAACLWVLGIPHAFSVVHGKTRRGALVFDVADIIKDSIILPLAFECAKARLSESDTRHRMLAALHDNESLGLLLRTVIEVCDHFDVKNMFSTS